MFTKENARELGTKGGRANVAKHGRSHMSNIGRKGFESTTKRYFQGSEHLHKQWLADEGRYQYFTVIGAAYGRKFDRERPLHPAKPGHTWF